MYVRTPSLPPRPDGRCPRRPPAAVRAAVRVPVGASVAVCVPLLQFMDAAEAQVTDVSPGGCGAVWAAGAPTAAAGGCAGLRGVWMVKGTGAVAAVVGSGEWELVLSAST